MKWQERISKYYRGEMHCHSRSSDRSHQGGVSDGDLHSARMILRYAEKLGLEFVVFSEHASTPGSPHRLRKNDPICEDIVIQSKYLNALNRHWQYAPVGIGAVEASIFFDEEDKAILDVPDEILKKLDLVIASRHAIRQQREPQKIKESLLAAIHNPLVDIIGHPYRHIEFYPHDWNYFRKYWRKNKKVHDELSVFDKHNLKKDIRRIIGREPLGDCRGNIIEFNSMFYSLERSYHEMWDEVLAEMELHKKIFEINLNSFDPSKSFYRNLLLKASRYGDLRFSIAFDFHNLAQTRKLKEDLGEAELSGIKSRGRKKVVKRLLALIDLLEELAIDRSRIINTSKNVLLAFIKEKKERI